VSRGLLRCEVRTLKGIYDLRGLRQSPQAEGVRRTRLR